MSEYSGEKSFDLKSAKRFIGLKSVSYKEYLAARHLFNGNFLHQGAILMNTCLEKALKVYLLVNDVNIDSATHDNIKLFRILENTNAKIAAGLNSDFLKVLSKIYLSRYYEKLPIGYNFVILKNQFLAELDYSFIYLNDLTKFRLGRDEVFPKSNFVRDKEKQLKVLVENNHVIDNISKEQYLTQAEYVYEFRIAPNHEIVEVLYKIKNTREPLKFIHEGLKILPDNHSVQLSQNQDGS